MTETVSLASGSVNEILDGIADVQEFRDSCPSLDIHYLDDLTIPDRILLERSSSDEKVSTIKKKPKNVNVHNINNNIASNNIILNNNKMNLTESDFINQALSGGGSGRVSRSNSSSALVAPNVPKVISKIKNEIK